PAAGRPHAGGAGGAGRADEVAPGGADCGGAGAGRLVGELLDDPECLDPRAATRRPVVVRLAYAAGGLTAADEDAMRAARRRTTPPPAESTPDEFAALAGRYAKVDHPYVRFLAARPEALTRARQPGEESYDAWRRRSDRSFAAADHPLPRRLRERVARWRDLE